MAKQSSTKGATEFEETAESLPTAVLKAYPRAIRFHASSAAIL